MRNSTEGAMAGFAGRSRHVSAHPSHASWPQKELHRTLFSSSGAHNCIWLGPSPGSFFRGVLVG
eukprot:5823021-Pyramimonas_sp.AAC.1